MLTRDDLEAMREEFSAGVRDDGGLPFGLDDDLHQMRLAEQTGLNLLATAGPSCEVEAVHATFSFTLSPLQRLTIDHLDYVNRGQDYGTED